MALSSLEEAAPAAVVLVLTRCARCARRVSRCEHPGATFKMVSMYRPQAAAPAHELNAVASRDKLLPRGVEQRWLKD